MAVSLFRERYTYTTSKSKGLISERRSTPSVGLLCLRFSGALGFLRVSLVGLVLFFILLEFRCWSITLLGVFQVFQRCKARWSSFSICLTEDFLSRYLTHLVDFRLSSTNLFSYWHVCSYTFYICWWCVALLSSFSSEHAGDFGYLWVLWFPLGSTCEQEEIFYLLWQGYFRGQNYWFSFCFRVWRGVVIL